MYIQKNAPNILYRYKKILRGDFLEFLLNDFFSQTIIEKKNFIKKFKFVMIVNR